MADFRSAISKVLRMEGGYVNDPTDNGGETYKGVSRKFWPRWTGWAFVDNYRTKPDFPKSLNAISQLQDSVMAFYKVNFWGKVGGDQIASQTIANLLVDSAVNEGVVPAVKRAQGIVLLAQTGVVTPELVEKLNLLV